jgi:hypothetical protein
MSLSAPCVSAPLKSLPEVDDDTEDDPAVQEDDDNEKASPGGLEAG